jgi:hypothetical protein
MTQLTIVTTPTNSGDGTPLATAFNYCNSNFSELYARFQVDPPASLIGTTGDFPGMYALSFEKAVSGWWIGREDESLTIFTRLLEQDIREDYKNTINYNIEKLGKNVTI